MVWVIAFSSPDNILIDPKVYARNLFTTYQTFGTVTNPAAETKSIGLLANAQLSWFLQSHLDSFILTRQLASVYRDCAKTHANPDTDGNSPYHRAVRLQLVLIFINENFLY
jgi:hypothetical protein